MSTQSPVTLPDAGDESPSRRFVGVIPIAHAGQGDDLTIIIGSLDRYDHDAKVHISLRLAPGHPRTRPGDRFQMLHPVPVMNVADDLGTAYRARQHGGGGTIHIMRSEYSITPGIPEHARRLAITVEFIAWEDMNTGEVRATTPGPWRFDVDLSRQLDAGWAT